jgi:hypothetical protein
MSAITIVVCDGCGVQIASSSPFDCVTATGLNVTAQYQVVHFGEACGCAAKIRAGAATIQNMALVTAAITAITNAAPAFFSVT